MKSFHCGKISTKDFEIISLCLILSIFSADENDTTLSFTGGIDSSTDRDIDFDFYRFGFRVDLNYIF